MCYRDAFIHKVSPFNKVATTTWLSYLSGQADWLRIVGNLPNQVPIAAAVHAIPNRYHEFSRTSTCVPRYLPAFRYCIAGSPREDPYLRKSRQLCSYMNLQSLRDTFCVPSVLKHQVSKASLCLIRPNSTPQLWSPFFLPTTRKMAIDRYVKLYFYNLDHTTTRFLDFSWGRAAPKAGKQHRSIPPNHQIAHVRVPCHELLISTTLSPGIGCIKNATFSWL